MPVGSSLWPIALALSAPLVSVERPADDPVAEPDEDVVVTGTKDPRPTTSTRLPLTLRETPQSVTVVDRQRIEDFNLTTITAVLGQTPGVTVTNTDSNRVSINIRGFAVRNFQLDGVPTIYQVGAYENSALGDLAIYDRVEVVRGAAGLVAGVGDPSATVNLVRKRAPAQFQGYFQAQAGRWSSYRFEGDVGGPVTRDGNVRARIAAAYTDAESYIDVQNDRVSVLYGTLEWDVTPQTRVRVGADYLRTDSRGAGWGSVPLLYSDGTRTNFPRSFTGTARWSRWLRETTTVFAAVEQDIAPDWLVRIGYNGRRGDNESGIFNVASGFPNRDGTGLGTFAPFYGEVPQNEDAVDAYVSGKFTLFGRRHEIVGGLNHFERDFVAGRNGFVQNFPGVPAPGNVDIDPWNPDFPRPPVIRGLPPLFSQDIRQIGGYGVVRLNPADWLKVIAGARYTDYLAEREQFGADGGVRPEVLNDVQRVRKWAPYGGIVADLTAAVSLYASYASIFNPVSALDEERRLLPPTTGANYEGGVKATPFGEGFTMSAAAFHIRQNNLTEQKPNTAPLDPGPPAIFPSQSISGVKTWGGEAEVAGEPLPGWTLNGSYTYARTTRFDRQQGMTVRVNPFFPLHIARLYTTYRLLHDRLTLGGGVSAQSRTFDRGRVPTGRFNPNGTPILTPDDPKLFAEVGQPGYIVVDLLARYRLTDRASIGVNVTNLFDRTYFNNVRFGFGGPGGFYAAPRSVVGNIRVSF